jgi:DNA end-binding protein Ku
MKSIWKGAISFGLVNIPVRLYSATERETVAFHMLSKRDNSRIRFLRVSEASGKEVPYEEIVKGYELEDGGTIEIQEFVDESEISSLYFDKPYYLEPDKTAAKAYALLRDALAKSGKVGISQFVLRNREHLCALKAMDEVLVLNALRFSSEIRAASELALPKKEKVSQSELSLALKLVEGLSDKFDPKKYKDTYTEEVRKLIDAKAKGQKIKAPAKAAPSTKVIDLTAALKESLKTPKKKRVA